jgi:hypothetical protein
VINRISPSSHQRHWSAPYKTGLINDPFFGGMFYAFTDVLNIAVPFMFEKDKNTTLPKFDF